MILKVLKPNKKDAFDDLPDAFEGVELPPDEKILYSDEFQKMIEKAVQEAVSQIKLPQPAPQKETIREVRVEVEKKDTRQLVEKSSLDAALKKIEELEKKLEETDLAARTPRIIPSAGGSGVIGIPDPGQATVDHVLTVVQTSDGKKAKFAASTGSGASISGYTINNPVTLKTIDLSSFTLDELGALVGTLIEELQP